MWLEVLGSPSVPRHQPHCQVPEGYPGLTPGASCRDVYTKPFSGI